MKKISLLRTFDRNKLRAYCVITVKHAAISALRRRQKEHPAAEDRLADTADEGRVEDGLMERAGVELHYEEQFMDAPTVSGGVMRLLRDGNAFTVLDVGGDYIGARSIGGYAPLLNRPETAVYYVVNPYRPWSGTLERLDQVLTDILTVSHLRFENLLLAANPNLGEGTTAEDILEGFRQLEALLEGRWPIRFAGAEERLVPAVEPLLPCPVFPVKRHILYPW